MSIWLWVVVFLTWCAFVYVWTSIRQFRELVMKNERLDHELSHAKRRLLRAENDLVSQDIHIKEQNEVLNEWIEALNEWKEAYEFQSDELDRTLDLLEQWYALDVKRRLFNSFEEVDDLLLQTATKEFIRLMAFARATEVKEKQNVVSINLHRDLANVVDDILETYKKIQGFYSEEGHQDIERLIEEEKLKFLNEEERSIINSL